MSKIKTPVEVREGTVTSFLYLYDADGEILARVSEQQYAEEITTAINTAAALRAALTQAKEALEPFAKIPCKGTWKDRENLMVEVNVGDIRRARAALAKVQP